MATDDASDLFADRRRALWGAASVGFILAPAAALVLATVVSAGLGRAVPVLFSLVGVSFVAAIAFGRAAKLGSGRGAADLQVAARAGLKVGFAGFAAAVLGLGVIVSIGVIFGGVFEGVLSVALFSVVVPLSVLPCCLAAIWGGRLMAEPHPQGGVAAAPVGSRQDRQGDNRADRSRLETVVLVLVTLLGVALPGIAIPARAVLRAEASRGTEKLPGVTPPEPVEPAVQGPVEGFEFAPAEGIADAEARQFRVEDVRRIVDGRVSLPVELAGNSRYLAFQRAARGGSEVRAVDLYTLETLAVFEVSASVVSLSWSPDSERLAILADSSSTPVGIGDLQTGEVTWLPRPLADQLPRLSSMNVVWWRPERLAFTGRGGSALLDLASLQVEVRDRDEPDSSLGRMLSRDEYADFDVAETRHPLPRNSRWLFDQVETAQLHGPTVRGGEVIVSFDGPPLIGVIESGRHVTQPLVGGPPVGNDSYVVLEREGSLLVALQRDGLYAYYLGLRAPPPKGFRVAASVERPGEVAELIAKSELAAVVCHPLRNPLRQGEVVGGDLTTYRALARVRSWNDEGISFWIDREERPVREGDVITCLSTYRDGNLVPLENPQLHRWWAVVVELNRDPSCSPPSDGEADDSGRLALEAAVVRFLEDHYVRFGLRDVEGLVGDYAEEFQVDGERWDRPKMESHIRQMFGRGIGRTAVVDSPIAVETLGEAEWRARFRVKLHLSSLLTEETTVTKETVTVRSIGGILQITEENSEQVGAE